MTVTLIAYAQFTASKVGKNSITVTWNIEQITRSDGTRSALVTGGATNVTIGRNGLYGYRLTGADLDLYDYVFTAITNDATVDIQEIPALWTKYTQTEDSIVDKVWDEPLTAATHNVASSSGRRLRQIASTIVIDGIAQGAGANGNQIVLDTDASSLDGAYDPALIAIVAGTGAGQCRLILQYDGSTKTATVDRTWRVNPVSGNSEYIIYADPGREHVNEGLARGGGANTITLNASASSTTDEYVGQTVFIRSGTGEDQACKVIAYNGTTKVATVARNWGTIPDTTSGYVMLPTGVLDVETLISETSDAVWANTNALSAADVWTYVTRTLTSGGGGLTAQEVWEYATRELTSLGTDVSTEIWNYPLRTLTPPDNKYSTSEYVVTTNWTLIKGITNKTRFLLGDLTDVQDILVSVKNKKSDANSAAIFYISDTLGLTVLNGATYTGSSTDGKFNIIDVTTGLVELEINVAACDEFIPTVNRWFDIKTVYADNTYRPVHGFCTIEWDVTRLT